MILIDPSTRQFNVPGADLTFGVESDAGSERKYFQCPRYVGNNLDLASCFIRMNFRNANGEMDSYLVDDVTVDGDNVVFSWVLSQKVTLYKGMIKFVVCAVGPSQKVEWHTTLGSGIVLEGLEPDVAVESETADVVAQLIAMVEQQTTAVENVGETWVANVRETGEKWVADTKAEGATQVANVKSAAETAEAASVAEIEAKGVNVRESIPEDYTALSEAVDTLTRSRAGAIVCEAAGETVMVTDSSNLPMQGLQVFGKTTQATTTGAQLTPYPYFNGNKTYNGITWTINPDGSVKAKGTATATSPLYFTNSTHELAPGQYTVSGSANGVTVRIDSTIRETGKWKAGVAISKNGQPVTFTVTEEDNATYFYTLYASVENGNTVDVTIYPMLNAGSSALPWEIYTGGKPSPSPDYPQELVSLEPVVTVAGRNLCPESAFATMSSNGTTNTYDATTHTITLTEDTTGNPGRYIQPYKKMVVGEPYTVSFDIRGTSGKKVHCGWDKKKVLITLTSDFVRYSTTVIATNTKEPVVFYGIATASGGLGAGEYMQFANVQIEAGAVANEYEPYVEIQTLSTTHTLPGIPVASGGNYTDSDGQQWICDEVDLERGVYVKRIQSITFDGTENWYVSTAQYSEGTRFDCNISGMPAALTTDVVCNRFAYKGTNKAVETVWVLNDYAAFRIITNKASSPDELYQYLAANPTTVLYALKTPAETALSETEIAAYRAMHSNYPNTTVLNDAGAHMVVKYAADTKLYIDNKITALIGG